VDDFFQRDLRGRLGVLAGTLLTLTDYRLVGALVAVASVVALLRTHWLLAALVVAAPLLAVWLARILKVLFGRYKGDSLAYPSGHTAFLVVALGMAVLVAGSRPWAIAAALLLGSLGVVGQAVTYHYFTDAVGAALLGAAVVCAAAALLQRLRPGELA